MTSRDRLVTTLNHKIPDRVCVDFGGTHVTGISASAISQLRLALLGEMDYRVKITEPYQMLGEIDGKLAEALGIDVLGVLSPKTMFGFENKDWKPFTMFDGTEVLVPGNFNLTSDGKGGWFIHPEGDTSVPPSGHMPKGGFYFDAIPRQDPIDDEKLNPEDNLEEFGPLDDYTLKYFASEAEKASAKGKGAILSVPGTGFGDIALIPAMWRKRTKGIREIEEWYVSTVIRRDYVYKVFEKQCEIALENLDRLTKALGDNVQAAFTTGTDFGTQNGLFISKEAYRDLFKPFHKAVNDFIHKHSNWKIFIHSCGSVVELISDFIDAGFDILNPVQCSAAGMQGQHLKKVYGKDIVFWGGGVDTQRTLPFGTPDDVYKQVRERIEMFNKDGGFVFNSTHNIQAKTPIKNIIAMFKAIEDSGKA
ncbi:MAG: uroporphyrinogen decarboxylase family protein [Kiritimatiellae bacterium]|nr:uroporphyrinogen decarboxylase family protein [Kiritimatiellia bacterium]